MKIPNLSGKDDDEVVARFIREARIAAKIEHRNICQIYDVGKIDGRYFISMAYVRGRPLSAFIGGDKIPPQKTTAILIHRLAAALAVAHEHGVIHRDLKPANIMVDLDRQPVVMDFGLARQADVESRVTRSGVMVGTPEYISPEQVRGDNEIGPTTDIYGLGVILFELLTGRLPFRGSLAHIVYKKVSEDPPTPSQFRDNIDAHLDVICRRMMARDAGDRYSSMDEVSAVISEYLTSQASRDAAGGHGRDGRPHPKSPQAPSSGKDSRECDVSDEALSAFFAAQPSGGSLQPRVSPAMPRSGRGTLSPRSIALIGVTLLGLFVAAYRDRNSGMSRDTRPVARSTADDRSKPEKLDELGTRSPVPPTGRDDSSPGAESALAPQAERGQDRRLHFFDPNDRIELPYFECRDSVTLEAILTPTFVKAPPWEVHVVLSNWDWQGKVGFDLEADPSMRWRTVVNCSGRQTRLSSLQRIVPFRRCHIASVLDRGQLRLYVDGKLQHSMTLRGKYTPSQLPMVVGNHPTGERAFCGWIHAVRISDCARYTKDFTPPTDGLSEDADTLVLLPLSEQKGGFAEDKSGNQLHGKIVPPRWRSVPPEEAFRSNELAPWAPKPGDWALRFVGGDSSFAIEDPVFDTSRPFTVELMAMPTRTLAHGEHRSDILRIHGSPISVGLSSHHAATAGAYGLVLGEEAAPRVSTSKDALPYAWTHLAVSGDGEVVVFYVDGRPVGPPVECKLEGDAVLEFGHRFDGLIGWARISNSVLKSSEMAVATQPTVGPTTVCLLRLDEGTGVQIQDCVRGFWGRGKNIHWADTSRWALVETLSVDSSPRRLGEHYYGVIPTPMSWDEARIACKKVGGHLATVETTTEQAALRGLLTQEKQLPLWSGGVLTPRGWTWSRGRPIAAELWGDGIASLGQVRSKSAGVFDLRHTRGILSALPTSFRCGSLCEWDRRPTQTDITGFMLYANPANLVQSSRQPMQFGEEVKLRISSLNASESFEIEKSANGFEISPMRGKLPTLVTITPRTESLCNYDFDLIDPTTQSRQHVAGQFLPTSWQIDYYACGARRDSLNSSLEPWGTELVGESVASSTAGRIAFDWRDEAPYAGVPKDQFAVIARTEVVVPAGAYAMTMAADDLVRVFVDGELFTHLGDRELVLAEGRHTIRVEYFDSGGEASLSFDFRPTNDRLAPRPWTVSYFAWERTGHEPPNEDQWREITSQDPLRTQESDRLRFDWPSAPAQGVPADYFAVVATTKVYLDAGWYRFTTFSDDGLRVFVDGEGFIDIWRAGGFSGDSGPFYVGSGEHDVRVEYFEWDLGAALHVDDLRRLSSPEYPKGVK